MCHHRSNLFRCISVAISLCGHKFYTYITTTWDYFDGVESIVVQLEGIGLSEADISELFQLTPRENGFNK